MSTSEPPVTECAFLNLVPPTPLEAPKLVQGFQAALVAQSAWSGYPLHLFFSTRDSDAEGGSPSPATTIFLISGWKSVQAHNEWIVSPKNQELLKFFGDAGLMSVGGLAHLAIDFTKLSFEECAAIVWRKWTHRADDAKENDGDSQGTSPAGSEVTSTSEPGLARKLWSYHGRAVDDGAEDVYELTGYSEGKLQDFPVGYTVTRRWDLGN